MTERSDDEAPPRFALHLEDLDGVACRAADAEGFFGGAPDADGRTTFRLVDATPGEANAWRAVASRALAKPVGNAEVWILDGAQQRIGAYFIADVRIVSRTAHRTGSGSASRSDQSHPGEALDIDIACLQVQPPHPLAGPIWDQWRQSPPTRRNQWTGLSSDGRAAWLEVVRLAWTPPSTGDAPAHSVFDLDGAHITDRPSFYCALGEAVNGPGGYFGADLDALADCLRGGFGATTPFTLVWHGQQESATRLSRLTGGDSDGSFYERALSILDAGGVIVRSAPPL
jgi:RNAse (barnase) inhibitor barstar